MAACLVPTLTATLCPGAAGRSPSKPRFDPAFVLPLEEVPSGIARRVMGERPIIARFSKDGYDLYYVAAIHENREDSATFRLIRRAFRDFQIRRVVVEGRENWRGAVPVGSAKEMAESDFAIRLAAARNVTAIGGEPSHKSEARAILAAGYSRQDLYGYWIVRQVPQWRREGRLQTTPFAKLFSEDVSWTRRELGDESFAFSYKDFLDWYRSRNGGDFDARKIAVETTRPDRHGALLTQRIAHASDMIRNRFIVDAISRELRQYRQVLVVFGNGHLATQWQAIANVMGQPVYVGDLIRP